MSDLTASELYQAKETLDRLALQQEGIVAAAKVLQKITSLEQHIAELTAKRDALFNDVRLQGEAVDQCNKKLTYLQDSHSAAMESLRVEREAYVNTTQTAAKEILDKAHAQAEQIVTEARQSLGVELEERHRQIGLANNLLSNLESDRREAINTLSTLNADIEKANAELNQVNAAIDKVVSSRRPA